MTKLLQQAFEKASALPESLQDELAQELLDELAGESKWDASLARSTDALDTLADEALDEHERGETSPKGFDEL